jgi:branched-subunit amino acid aminotransferase/4-amino-4-deoxychorismate lyase
MENQRLLVWATFGMLLWLTYQSWTQDYGPQSAATPQQTADESLQPPNDADTQPSLPATTLDAPQIDEQPAAQQGATNDAPAADSEIIRVVTDVLEIEINTRGATLQRATLAKYPVAKDQPNTLVELLNPTMPEFGLVQTGLRSAGDGEEANHLAMFKAKANVNYINSLLARREALDSGAEEALLLDNEGYVAEGSGENVFIVRNDTIYTPDLTSCLEGITRDALFVLAEELGYRVREKRITRDEVYIADEAFFSGTAAEVVPIRELDGRTIGTGSRGPLTTKLQAMYFDTVRGNRSQNSHWLEPVG